MVVNGVSKVFETNKSGRRIFAWIVFWCTLDFECNNSFDRCASVLGIVNDSVGR